MQVLNNVRTKTKLCFLSKMADGCEVLISTSVTGAYSFPLCMCLLFFLWVGRMQSHTIKSLAVLQCSTFSTCFQLSTMELHASMPQRFILISKIARKACTFVLVVFNSIN